MNLSKETPKYKSIPSKSFIQVLKILKSLEEEHGIKILYAIDNGSRNNGLWHNESDFDIRFIFSYKKKILNSVEGRKYCGARDTIEGFSDDRVYDWQGWCIDKAVRHLSESNPSLIEWMYADIVYINYADSINGTDVVGDMSVPNNLRTDFCKVLNQMHSVKSMFYHYLNMAKKNYNTFVSGQDEVIYKKYLYVLRPLLMIIYIQSDYYEKRGKIYPVINDFYKLLNIAIKIDTDENDSNSLIKFTPEVLADIDTVIKMKKDDKHHAGEPLPNFNKWLGDTLDVLSGYRFGKKGKEDNKETNESFVIQSLVSTFAKFNNETSKLLAISAKSDLVNRSNFLTFFAQYLTFTWLVQHPTKITRECPAKISDIIKQVTLDSEIKEWIEAVIQDKETLKEDINIVNKRKEVCGKILDLMMSGLELIDEKCLEKKKIDILKEDMLHSPHGIIRGDFVDYNVNSLLQAIYLALTNKSIRDIPSNMLNSKDERINKETLKKASALITELNPKFYVKMNNTIVRKMIDEVQSQKEYVAEASAKYNKKKALDKQEMYQGAVKEVDPEEFISLLETYAI